MPHPVPRTGVRIRTMSADTAVRRSPPSALIPLGQIYLARNLETKGLVTSPSARRQRRVARPQEPHAAILAHFARLLGCV
jgi:hypothetical protein